MNVQVFDTGTTVAPAYFGSDVLIRRARRMYTRLTVVSQPFPRFYHEV